MSVLRSFVTMSAMLAAMSAASSLRADMVYLSLGDSIAFGYDPSTPGTLAPSLGDQGFVKRFADALAARNGGARPTVLNLGIAGEQSTSFFDPSNLSPSGPPRSWALNQNYSAGTISQNSLMLSSITALHAAGHQIGVVTLLFGANDLFALTASSAFQGASPSDQAAMIGQTITTAITNYATVLGQLQAIAPEAAVFLPGYYNPFPPALAPTEHAFYDLVLGNFHSNLQNIAKLFGATYVDIYSPFAGRELALTNIGVGDIHPNQAGYAVIASTLGASSVPEPSAVVSLVLGLGALGAARFSRRRLSARQAAS